MKNFLFLLAFLPLLHYGCGVKNPLAKDDNYYRHCDTQNNLCIQYPRAVFPPPDEGRDKDSKDLILGLYSEEYDIRLLLSADANAEALSFDQIYEQQITNWEETYDDVDIVTSNITDSGYEVSATGEDYSLYAKSSRLAAGGKIIHLRLVAGPEVTPVFFTDLKKNILVFPNK